MTLLRSPINWFFMIAFLLKRFNFKEIIFLYSYFHSTLTALMPL